MTQRHSIRHLGPASASDILVLEKFAIYTRIKPEISLKTLCALDPKEKAITQAMTKPSELTCVVTSSVELTHL